MTVYECEGCGRTLRYIQTNSGRYLYEQRRHLLPETWKNELIRMLHRARFSIDEIVEMWPDATRDAYYNRAFYRPPRSIVQEQLESRM